MTTWISFFCRRQWSEWFLVLIGTNYSSLLAQPDTSKSIRKCNCTIILDSQKVRLAVEEKGIDYTSHHANPITGKNLDSSFFNMKPGGRLPDFQNGSHILCKTIDIIQYALFTTYSFTILLLLPQIHVYKRNFTLKIDMAL